MKSIKLGLIGLGVVGCGVIDLLNNRAKSLAARIGAPVLLTRVAVRDPDKKRAVDVDKSIITNDPVKIVEADDVDIVVEVMGGEDPALGLALKAAQNGKHIVTANKLLLAMHGETVYEAVETCGVELGYEAAVAGAIPIIRSLKGAFAADNVSSIHGIVNGTCNYILSRMADEGLSFDNALAEAKRLGFAEADPTLDVEGIDSAHKIAILASLVFETPIDFTGIYTEGIRSISPLDVAMAKEFGYRIKSLAIVKRRSDTIDVRVHPAMIPNQNPIANVNGSLNAVELTAESAGVNMLVGPGAGAGPTASAIMGDVVHIARKILRGGAGKSYPMNVPVKSRKKIELCGIDEVQTQYYMRFTVPDRPGVLALIAGALGEHKISIASMIQRGHEADKPVSVVLMTHLAREKDLRAALKKIDALNVCAAPTVTIRIENGEK